MGFKLGQVADITDMITFSVPIYVFSFDWVTQTGLNLFNTFQDGYITLAPATQILDFTSSGGLDIGFDGTYDIAFP